MWRMCLLFLLALGFARALSAQESYALDPRYARIGFTVSHLGLFTTEGRFQRFDSQLTIDPTTPRDMHISVRIDAASASLASPEGEDLLRSAAYFDSAHYPDIRFHSTEVRETTPADFAVLGELEIRGVRQSVTLAVRLTNRRRDPADGRETVDCIVTGRVLRSVFGMTADHDFIDDAIALKISARLQVPATPPHGP
jgi:polyisoprenoid-binding protein YceI